MEDLEVTEDGREKISKILSNYFFSMEVKSGARPKKNLPPSLGLASRCRFLRITTLT